MEIKDELKKNYVKNLTCHYFNDLIKDKDIYSVDILLDEKSYETNKNILLYNISYKTSTGPKPVRTRFDKIDGLIRVFDDKFKHLVLFD